jgi:UDP-N-acetylmuramoyl-L-alanine---L-glutamate ligase
MRFAELEHASVAIWGYGREGRSVLAALRRRHPDKALTLYCKPDEAADAQALGDARLRVVASAPDADALASHGFVIKSPGISAYRPEILAARERGTRFTSGTALWFGENASARAIAVTGTKGKSTTTAMIAHCARALGVCTALAGNIGLPLLDLDGQRADLWAIELSSFQTGEAGPVDVGVIVNLAEEHLDWHGTHERYLADKLKLADVSRTLLVNAQSPLLMKRTDSHPHRITFGDTGGWHVGGGELCRGDAAMTSALVAVRIPGAHNALNACAALAALDAFGVLDADSRALDAAHALAGFRGLPHRLQSLGVRDGIEWIDDSISTTPDAALAAMESLRGRAVTMILGGHDRGLDWTAFAQALRARPPHAVIVQGAAGPRIAHVLHDAGIACQVEETVDLADAVERARMLAPTGSVILLSPGAPSFDQFRDYAARGLAFAQLAGFDHETLGEIAGLGIA